VFFIGTERANTSDSVPSWAKRTANFSGNSTATGISAADELSASAETLAGSTGSSPEFDAGTDVAATLLVAGAGENAAGASGLLSEPCPEAAGVAFASNTSESDPAGEAGTVRLSDRTAGLVATATRERGSGVAKIPSFAATERATRASAVGRIRTVAWDEKSIPDTTGSTSSAAGSSSTGEREVVRGCAENAASVAVAGSSWPTDTAGALTRDESSGNSVGTAAAAGAGFATFPLKSIGVLRAIPAAGTWPGLEAGTLRLPRSSLAPVLPVG